MHDMAGFAAGLGALLQTLVQFYADNNLDSQSVV